MQMGKRYRCGTCGTEVMVTRPSAGEPSCCSEQMVLSKPKEVQSAD
jgi:hypothetical protein